MDLLHKQSGEQNQLMITYFLMSCLQARFHPEALEEARRMAGQWDTEWDLVEQRISQESIAPPIYTIVRGQDLLPEALEKRLHRAFVDTLSLNAFHLNELEQTLVGLSAAGIETMVLKGAALVTSIYSNEAPRRFNDLDLLVRWNDMNGAIAALEDLGYSNACGIRPGAGDNWPMSEFKMGKPGFIETGIDLHRHLFSWYHYINRVPIDWFWQTAESIKIGQAGSKMLGPEALLLHLCVHVHQHHGTTWYASLRLLHDIAEVIMHYQAAFDWELLLSKAEAFGLVLPVKESLLRVQEGWQIPIPNAAQERLSSLRVSEEDVRNYADFKTFGSSSRRDRAAIKLALLPDWRSRLRFIYHRLRRTICLSLRK